MKRTRLSRAVAGATTLVALLAFAGCASETTTTTGGGGDDAAKVDWPTKPIDLYLGYDTGGSADPIARKLAELLGNQTKVTVSVQNRPGASGAVATTEVLTKKPDGYTLAIAPNSQLTVTPARSKEKLTYSGPDDWTSLAGLLIQQNGLMVRGNSEWKTLEDFIAAAKARPGKITVGVSSLNGANAMGMASLMKAADFKVKLVPFEGGAGEATAALLGGHIDAMNGTLSGQLGQLKSGDMISLGHSGKLPYTPASSKPFAEQGFEITSLAETTYYMYGPKGMPADLQAAISAAVQKLVESQEWKAWLDSNGYQDHFLKPQETTAELKQSAQDATEAVELLKSAGLID
jgi:tripartite-type tricarboxylate transporter receptor subunit TctC